MKDAVKVRTLANGVMGVILVMALLACGSPAVSPGAGATPSPVRSPSPPSPIATPFPSPRHTVEGVMSRLPASPYMDRKHLDKGLTCNSCHIPFPPQGAPTKEVCLTCHGGSYQELAALTEKVSPNPHSSHLGEADCASCHKSHQPFVYLCSACHSFGGGERFR